MKGNSRYTEEEIRRYSGKDERPVQVRMFGHAFLARNIGDRKLFVVSMKTPYTALRRLWLLLPTPVRTSAVLQLLKNCGRGIVRTHNDVYTSHYYREMEPAAAKAAPVIARSIQESFAPARVVDVGCGTGALLASLKDSGCFCLGLEYADAGVEMCLSRGLNVQKFDIRKDSVETPSEGFDVAISMEVAEHLLAKYVDRYLDLLTMLSRHIVFTAALPGQGGTDHVNEQPKEYWIDRFSKRGFVFDQSISDNWRLAWQNAGIAFWYYENIMVFHNASSKK